MMLLCQKAILARGARAERKAGEMLKQLERGVGGQPTHNNMLRVEPSEYKEVLDTQGINFMQASRWQKLASMPEEELKQMPIRKMFYLIIVKY